MDKKKIEKLIDALIYNCACPGEIGLKEVTNCCPPWDEYCNNCWRIALGMEPVNE